MGEMDRLIRELSERRRKLQQGGGEAAARKQRAAGKMTARERLDAFFDPGTFVELDLFAQPMGTDYGLAQAELPGDGVITGHGKVNGRTVFAYSQDFTVLTGTFGERHGRKICKTIDLAQKLGAPVVGMNDSGGARVSEELGALSTYGQLFRRHAQASGVIPQIALILGPVAGGQAYSPALMDFVFMVRRTSYLFLAGPPIVEAVVFQKTTNERLGGAEIHARISGVCDVLAADEKECLGLTRELLSFLPNRWDQKPPREEPDDDPHRSCKKLRRILPVESRRVYDVREVIAEVVDGGRLFEIKREYAANLVAGFARLNGWPVGFVANNPVVKAGCLDVEAAEKGARFVRFCDAFQIPIVSFQDTPGCLVGEEMERRGIVRHGAKLLYAFAEATVPKITVVLRKGFAAGYLAMGGKDLGADFVFALPTAQVCLMGAEAAVSVLFRQELRSAKDAATLRREREEEFARKYMNPYYAAGKQHIDDIIEPEQIRWRLIQALEVCQSKREPLPRRKHGNMPV